MGNWGRHSSSQPAHLDDHQPGHWTDPHRELSEGRQQLLDDHEEFMSQLMPPPRPPPRLREPLFWNEYAIIESDNVGAKTPNVVNLKCRIHVKISLNCLEEARKSFGTDEYLLLFALHFASFLVMHSCHSGRWLVSATAHERDSGLDFLIR
ncbi:hypothetical protein Scep_016786 [Stephania cephalantha]|uniref:Uncharacterized protein n=1 Tax=Stephania cephalantha TaxID=152367 RepID=A0AAP0INB0_9MAGN